MNTYVYVYLDPRKSGDYSYNEYSFCYEPFYVGIGKGSRLLDHLSYKEHYNPFLGRKINRIRKIGRFPVITKLQENLFREEAQSKEKELILKIGKFPQGPLTNLTDGGDGFTGKHTQETKDRISEKNKLIKHTKEWSEKIVLSRKQNGSYMVSEDVKEYLSELGKKRVGEKNSFYGKHHTEEWKKNHSECMEKKESKKKNKTFEEIYGTEKAKELKEKHSLVMKGKPSWNKGIKLTEEHKRKIGESHKKQKELENASF